MLQKITCKSDKLNRNLKTQQEINSRYYLSANAQAGTGKQAQA